MTREENIFLAKKLFVELVYNTAYIEGCNVTFPQTQTIIDGGVVNNVSVSDIQTVLNLRDAWRFALENIDVPLTLDYLCKVNEFVSRNESLQWGTLRTGRVGISGTAYQPPVPVKEEAEAKIERIALITDPIERAAEIFCYSVRSQLFWDGNKRTATIAASKILIQNNAGVLSINPSNANEFNESLLRHYDTGDSAPLKACLYKCVKTMERYSEHPRAEAATQDMDDALEMEI